MHKKSCRQFFFYTYKRKKDEKLHINSDIFTVVGLCNQPVSWSKPAWTSNREMQSSSLKTTEGTF